MATVVWKKGALQVGCQAWAKEELRVIHAHALEKMADFHQVCAEDFEWLNEYMGSILGHRAAASSSLGHSPASPVGRQDCNIVSVLKTPARLRQRPAEQEDRSGERKDRSGERKDRLTEEINSRSAERLNRSGERMNRSGVLALRIQTGQHDFYAEYAEAAQQHEDQPDEDSPLTHRPPLRPLDQAVVWPRERSSPASFVVGPSEIHLHTADRRSSDEREKISSPLVIVPVAPSHRESSLSPSRAQTEAASLGYAAPLESAAEPQLASKDIIMNEPSSPHGDSASPVENQGRSAELTRTIIAEPAVIRSPSEMPTNPPETIDEHVYTSHSVSHAKTCAFPEPKPQVAYTPPTMGRLGKIPSTERLHSKPVVRTSVASSIPSSPFIEQGGPSPSKTKQVQETETMSPVLSSIHFATLPPRPPLNKKSLGKTRVEKLKALDSKLPARNNAASDDNSQYNFYEVKLHSISPVNPALCLPANMDPLNKIDDELQLRDKQLKDVFTSESQRIHEALSSLRTSKSSMTPSEPPRTSAVSAPSAEDHLVAKTPYNESIASQATLDKSCASKTTFGQITDPILPTEGVAISNDILQIDTNFAEDNITPKPSLEEDTSKHSAQRLDGFESANPRNQLVKNDEISSSSDLVKSQVLPMKTEEQTRPKKSIKEIREINKVKPKQAPINIRVPTASQLHLDHNHRRPTGVTGSHFTLATSATLDRAHTSLDTTYDTSHPKNQISNPTPNPSRHAASQLEKNVSQTIAKSDLAVDKKDRSNVERRLIHRQNVEKRRLELQAKQQEVRRARLETRKQEIRNKKVGEMNEAEIERQQLRSAQNGKQATIRLSKQIISESNHKPNLRPGDDLQTINLKDTAAHRTEVQSVKRPLKLANKVSMNHGQHNEHEASTRQTSVKASRISQLQEEVTKPRQDVMANKSRVSVMKPLRVSHVGRKTLVNKPLLERDRSQLNAQPGSINLKTNPYTSVKPPLHSSNTAHKHNMIPQVDLVKYSSETIHFGAKTAAKSTSATANTAINSASTTASAIVNTDHIELPEIDSDFSDEEDTPAKRIKHDIPPWADSPELLELLRRQAQINPDDVFGAVAPLQMEDIFKGRASSMSSRFRPRSSSANWSGQDRLTPNEVEEYVRLMGYQ